MAKTIQSIALGFRVLRAVVDAEEPAGLKAVAEAAGLPPSKARMYLLSLMETKLIAQDPATGHYSLGPYALHLGVRAAQRLDSMTAARNAAQALSEETRADVLVSMWTDAGATIIARAHGKDRLPIEFRIGGSAFLLSTATGGVFLAFGPQKDVQACIDRELDNAATDAKTRRAILADIGHAVAEIRETSVGQADEVHLASGIVLHGFGALAAPVFGAGGELRFVLTLIHRKLPRQDGEGLRRAVREAAAQASRLTGGGDEPLAAGAPRRKAVSLRENPRAAD